MTDQLLQTAINLLIVDDSISDRVTYSRYLQSDSEQSYCILESETLEEGLELWRSQQPDIVLIDLNLPDGDGLEFLAAINVELVGDRVPVIVLTGQGNEKMAVNAMKLGAADYLVKADITAKSLVTTVRQVLRETMLSRQLRRSQQQQILISEIALRIREFTDLEDISNAIVKEVRQFISADRAITYKFNPDMSGTIVAEDVASSWQPCLNVQVEDTCFRENLGGAYCEGKIFVANDIYAANLTDCHIKLLERFQVRANLVVPILLPNVEQRTLWGLLIIHQCSAPRIWEESDIQLLQRLSVKLSISIKQAIAYQQVQTELAERKWVETLLLNQQVEIEERNDLLERTNEELQCTIEELKVSTDELIYQHRQLEYEQYRYQNLFDFAPDGYLVTDSSGKILEVNQVVLELFGISREFILAKPLICFVASDNKDLFYRQLHHQLSPTNTKTTWEITLINSHKATFPAEITVTQNINLAIDKTQLFWMIRDISDRKRAEQELLQLNQSLEAKVTERTQAIQLQSQMLEQIHDAVISTAMDGTIQTWNIGAERIYEYKSNEAIGQNVSMLYLNEDLALMETTVFRPLFENGTHEVELRNRTKSGKIIYIRLRLSLVRDALGQPIRLIGCSNNISDRKLAEESLRESEQRFENLSKAAPVAIFQIDQNNECTYVNEFWSQITGQESSMALGYGWLQTIHPDDREQIHQQWMQTIEQRASYQGEGRCIKLDGTIRYYYCQALPKLDENGVFKGYIGTLTDISDRKQSENALRDSQILLQTVLDAFPLSIFWKDRQSVYLGCNQLFATTSGIKSPLEALGKSNFDFSYTEEEALAYLADDQQVMESGLAKLNIEETITLPSGEQQWIQTNKVPLRDAEGNVIGVMGSFQDISDRKLAEQALQQQLAAIEAAIDGIAILQNNKYIYLNQAHLEIFGYDHPDELLGKSWTKLYSSEELTRFEQEVFPVLQRDRSWQGEAIAIRKNGSAFDEELSLTTTDTGLLICVCRNISDRKQAKIALQESRHFIQTVLDTIPIPLFWKDRESMYLGCNAQFASVFNLESTDAIVGKNDFELSGTESDVIAYRQDDREVMESGKSKLGILETLTLPDGKEIWIETHKAPIRDWANNVIGVVAMFQDITNRKLAEVRLQETNEQLLLATRLKDEFLANMSHELRTPLNSILGLSESLQDEILGSLNERQLKAISTIASSGEHLLSLINDILDLSKISSGMMALDIESVSVNNLCSSSLVFIKQQAFKKRIQINRNIPPHIGNINIDERRLKQVLINLLTNSVKFTPSEGQISLLVATGSGDTWQGEATIPQRLRDMNSPMIVFQVVDTGIGIAPNDLRRLFQPFVQVDSALNRQYEGTGLGLALVKQIVELHGGQVIAESEVGQGSCFTVALPYEMSQSSASESEPSATNSLPMVVNPENAIAPLILIAEDNDANIQTFTSYLTAINYRVIVARNGEEAVSMAKANFPDIILMDIQMPSMDGLEATKQIRLDPNLINTQIIALTALAMEGDRERCLAAGANDYMAKPIKLRQLNFLIQQVLGSVK